MALCFFSHINLHSLNKKYVNFLSWMFICKSDNWIDNFILQLPKISNHVSHLCGWFYSAKFHALVSCHSALLFLTLSENQPLSSNLLCLGADKAKLL